MALIAQEIRDRFPGVTVNTYRDHPWPGWDGRSIDVWGPGGRGDPVALHTGHAVRKWAFNKPGAPWLRHTIYLHTLWTSFGGSSWWAANDHGGELRHVHLTYW